MRLLADDHVLGHQVIQERWCLALYLLDPKVQCRLQRLHMKQFHRDSRTTKRAPLVNAKLHSYQLDFSQLKNPQQAR
jgi:hypothetical protein